MNLEPSEGKAKETKRKMLVVIRRFKEIRRYLLQPNSPVSAGLSTISSQFLSELADDLHRYKIITMDQIVFALYQKKQRGVLCVRVYQGKASKKKINKLGFLAEPRLTPPPTLCSDPILNLIVGFYNFRCRIVPKGAGLAP